MTTQRVLYRVVSFKPSGRRFRHSWVDHIVTPDFDGGHTYAGGSLSWVRSLCGIVGGVRTPDGWQPLGTIALGRASLCRSCRRVAISKLDD